MLSVNQESEKMRINPINLCGIKSHPKSDKTSVNLLSKNDEVSFGLNLVEKIRDRKKLNELAPKMRFEANRIYSSILDAQRYSDKEVDLAMNNLYDIHSSLHEIFGDEMTIPVQKYDKQTAGGITTSIVKDIARVVNPQGRVVAFENDGEVFLIRKQVSEELDSLRRPRKEILTITSGENPYNVLEIVFSQGSDRISGKLLKVMGGNVNEIDFDSATYAPPKATSKKVNISKINDEITHMDQRFDFRRDGTKAYFENYTGGIFRKHSKGFKFNFGDSVVKISKEYNTLSTGGRRCYELNDMRLDRISPEEF